MHRAQPWFTWEHPTWIGVVIPAGFVLSGTRSHARAERFCIEKDISIQLRLSINIYSMCVIDITLHGTSIGEAGAVAHTMRKQGPIGLQYYI